MAVSKMKAAAPRLAVRRNAITVLGQEGYERAANKGRTMRSAEEQEKADATAADSIDCSISCGSTLAA